ncbi:ABC-2 type transporter-domain-containing protein [Aspergillus caelatus]|uniref:ABC-2 type transporter-domain-containing protein n=1 Tax=Aspergillus caelatus TaxID=61420 RepID=A0A5N7ACU2_9EURO|nr:ABC-2 type transporter-domain-containing protein [Aspergillus caelatus]KAE8366440.1 ABC-2 type transporter-domain-containing protein [Aspergillus caelatus]
MSREFSPAACALSAICCLYTVFSTCPLPVKLNKLDAYKWARTRLNQLDEEGILRKHAGVVFKNLSLSGSGAALQLQETVSSTLLAPFLPESYRKIMHLAPKRQILHNFDGFLRSGEMLMVLGRPGSGCSTFHKTICGELHGLELHPDSVMHYNGIPWKKMHKEFKGEFVYNQTPSHRLAGVSRKQYVKETTQVAMAVLSLSHTYNTRVGDDYIRGVSGGERKLARAPLAAWDNSTRGLDAASALAFVKALRISADLAGACHAVATYQASQAIYDVFDKVIVLYDGREIYFGPCKQAEKYFTTMGWVNPPRQTVGDFLTSVTNTHERNAQEGMEDIVPRTPEEFQRYWKSSPEYATLLKQIRQYESEYPLGSHGQEDVSAGKRMEQAKNVRSGSPYLISVPMQPKLCMIRAYQRIWNDKTSTLTLLVGRVVMSLVVDTPDANAAFFAKGSLLFFATLLNALISVMEINSLYDQRPIVEKQASYAFLVSAVLFNVVIYFLGSLRYTASQFFIFFLFSFLSTMIMSAVFRTLTAVTRSVAQAMALAGLMILIIVIYAGFVIPAPEMHPWFSWLRWINTLFYTFESLISNEFHERSFECSQFIPGYPSFSGDAFVCSVPGSVAGVRTVSGDSFIYAQYRYSYSHEWRNLGILIGFWTFFNFLYLIATELNSATSSTSEFLVFRRGHVPGYRKATIQDTEKTPTSQTPGLKSPAENGEPVDLSTVMPEQRSTFTWQDLCYDIPVKGGQRRLLDHVDGWVKPGALTALMGVSGAGKTTLLDVLAQRVSIGVVTGDMLVNGGSLPASFQRQTGYVQQQDLHLATSTVREALRFSAMLRQPKSVSKVDKYDYVEQVIKMLNMKDFAEAVVGTPGEGLNVEQRKLLTIGVGLAAKPQLLLFLDEPTSGLDSQSAWSICAFFCKLANNGQAVLSTIHQPSAILFQQFDRLLFLAKGGRTVYFGEIGEQSRTLLSYFERNGARECDPSENIRPIHPPAEYMLEIIGAGASGQATKDWPVVWKESPEAREVKVELGRIRATQCVPNGGPAPIDKLSDDQGEYAMPLTAQFWWVTHRVFQQYWREPAYIGAKFMLGVVSALFIGFSYFLPGHSIQGIQNLLFSSFMLTSIFSTLVQQIMPKFVTQCSLYEVRERPSKAYSWVAFVVSNIVVEIPYMAILGVLVWASYYYPIYGANQSSDKQGLMLLFVIQFFLFTSTFADLVISSLPDAETAGTVATLSFALTLTFNGVMQTPNALPGFWIFMYRVSALTYLIAGMCGNTLHGQSVQCSSKELSVFSPPQGQTCGQYMADWLSVSPCQLYNPSATTNCEFCAFTTADQYLSLSNIYYSQRWRNFGIGWAYIGFNIAGAAILYYVFSVRHYKTTLLPRVVTACGKVLHRLFRRRSGTVPQEKKAENRRVL